VSSDPQHLLAFDMEGVFTPEIWLELADHTNIEGLRRTTRDEPNYEVLMSGRLKILDEHGITLSDIVRLVEPLEPLPGAVEFLHSVRSEYSVVLLSDTFEQLATPLFERLGFPLVLCHRLVVENDRIRSAKVRIPDAKRMAVKNFTAMGYSVVAVGDSFNDLNMLRAADHGLLFNAPEHIRDSNSDLAAVNDYDAVYSWIKQQTAR
jgi:phosphoserine/homoserine phosphotransferase